MNESNKQSLQKKKIILDLLKMVRAKHKINIHVDQKKNHKI